MTASPRHRSSPHSSLCPDPQQPPRDPARPRPAAPAAVVARDTAAAEADLTAKIAASPTTLALYYQLARLQERRGAFNDAEATLLRAREVAPSDKDAVGRARALLQPPTERSSRQSRLWKPWPSSTPPTRRPYLVIGTLLLGQGVQRQGASPVAAAQLHHRKAVSATDRALALDADHVQALTFKSLLLKQRATLETDPVQKQQLVAEADALRNRALEINKTQGGRPMPNRLRLAAGHGTSRECRARCRQSASAATSRRRRRSGTSRRSIPPDAQSAGISGRRHSRGDGRGRRPRVRREGAALHSAPGSGGARCGAPVGVHAHAPERRPRAGHHDGHGELLAAVTEEQDGRSSLRSNVTRSNGGTEVIDLKQ